jgi:hypothetical protein
MVWFQFGALDWHGPLLIKQSRKCGMGARKLEEGQKEAKNWDEIILELGEYE